jgi:hypothetical protein
MNALTQTDCEHCHGNRYRFDRKNGNAVACPYCNSGKERPPFINPIHHKVDPETSRKAALEITRSGRRATDAELVLDAVRSLPGSTGTELYNAIDELNLYGVRRRLTDLLARGQVRQGDVRGREVTWWPEA